MTPRKWRRGIAAGIFGFSGLVFLAACGGPRIPPAAASPSQPRKIPVNVVTASVGTISVNRSYAAIVEPVDQVDVVSLATGRVKTLTVDIGAKVKKDQMIAELSHGALEVQLQGAEATLANAQAQLASVQAAAGPNRRKAQVQLDAARAVLAQLLNPSASDIQVAASAVSIAQSGLDNANAGLNLLLDPPSSEIQVRRSAVSTAQTGLDSAKILLDQLLNPSATAVAAAQETVADAQADLSAAQSELNQAIAKDRSWQIMLGPRISFQANKATLDNPSISEGLTPEEISDAQQAVIANQEQVSILMTQFRSASWAPEDIWNSTSLISEEIRIALWDESKALSALETARAELFELQSPDDRIAALARHSVAIAQDSLESARAVLSELEDPGRIAIAQAKHGVEAAQASLEAETARLNLLHNPNLAEMAAAMAAVTVAEQTLALNQSAFTLHDLQAERARVDQAKAQVNLIERQLEDLKILAPFDGFVAKRWLSAGAMASPQTPIVTVYSDDVLVSLRIEEMEVKSLQQGQQALFTSPGLYAKTFDLRIDDISPTGEPAAHTFSVQMSPVGKVPDLKPGMSGQVSISSRRDNVVVAPRIALLARDGRSAVFVVQDGEARLRIVDLGLVNGEYMEIMNGVEPGDRIVVAGQHLLNDATPVIIDESLKWRDPAK